MNWYKKANSIEDQLGDCYVLSGRYVLQNENAKLIHGIITNKTGDGKTWNHAWVEYDNKVLDLVIGEEFEKEVYYNFYIPQIIERYSHEDVMKTMLRYNHWGPWNEQNPPKARELD